METIQITPSGTDAANTLQVTISKKADVTTFTGSIVQLQQRMANRAKIIASLQDEQTNDQNLIDRITAVFVSAGVTDVTAPMTDTLNAAVVTQNQEDTANAINSEVATLQAAQPVQTTQMTKA